VPPSLSVVMPVYNEQAAVHLSAADVQRHILDVVAGSELLAVDDGSTDASGRVLDEIAAADPRVRVIHQANRGHGGALMAGLALAQGEVLLIDSDRQIALDSFATAWRYIQHGREGVFGVRRIRHDPQLRLYVMRLVRFAIRVLFSVRIFDANVPYKLLRRAIWTEASACIPPDTLAPSLFLAIFVRLKRYDIVEMDIEHRSRAGGVVSIRRLKLLKFLLRAFAQLMAFRRCVAHVR
jgi:dolichol-phosphate mannosyltransferase